jgi:hypothetical protein
VELVGRYSNPDKWGHLTDTTLALAEPAVDVQASDEPIIQPSSCSCRRPWSVADRLGEEVVIDLIRDRRSGASHRALAERYGISLSSVKRVMRRHRH